MYVIDEITLENLASHMSKLSWDIADPVIRTYRELETLDEYLENKVKQEPKKELKTKK